ncbi:MAG: hypothetical protein C7B44_01920, partial [Sulfobacillus thermosulfidooxidans]
MHETERYPDWARSMKHAQEDIGLLMAHLMEWKAIFDQELPTDTAYRLRPTRTAPPSFRMSPALTRLRPGLKRPLPYQ